MSAFLVFVVRLGIQAIASFFANKAAKAVGDKVVNHLNKPKQ